VLDVSDLLLGILLQIRYWVYFVAQMAVDESRSFVGVQGQVSGIAQDGLVYLETPLLALQCLFQESLVFVYYRLSLLHIGVLQAGVAEVGVDDFHAVVVGVLESDAYLAHLGVADREHEVALRLQVIPVPLVGQLQAILHIRLSNLILLLVECILREQVVHLVQDLIVLAEDEHWLHPEQTLVVRLGLFEEPEEQDYVLRRVVPRQQRVLVLLHEVQFDLRLYLLHLECFSTPLP
jgi:hypothetical protein